MKIKKLLVLEAFLSFLIKKKACTSLLELFGTYYRGHSFLLTDEMFVNRDQFLQIFQLHLRIKDESTRIG